MAEARKGFQFFRRDFLFGALAGGAATAGTGLLMPIEWHQKVLPEGNQLVFGQCGEDLLVSQLFQHLQIDKPSYMDVGAYHPTIGSNTYNLYRSGSRGTLIEPNVDMIADLKSKRPEDQVLNIGIGLGEEGEADFYVLNYPQLNTFDEEEAKTRVANSGGKLRIDRVVKMPLVDINRIIRENHGDKAPDFLSVDTEGLDFSILKTLDFSKYRPMVICAETVQYSTLKSIDTIGDLLKENGYVLRCQTIANSIYLRKDLL
ncbi:MAG: FkbM family methyltransferase [Zavarzinella sp.]